MTDSLHVWLWLCPFGNDMVTHGLQTGESVIPFCLQRLLRISFHAPQGARNPYDVLNPDASSQGFLARMARSE
jgi:hypothetical protein